MAPVIFYDIPSKPPAKSWSVNMWKPRMVLNFKGIDYKTEWIEYPDLASTFKSFGLSPNDPTDPTYFADYTAPAIRFEDGTLMMDSWLQAHELEKRYPSPPLHLDDPIVARVKDDVVKLAKALTPATVPKVSRNLLNHSSHVYFEKTRHERFGMPLLQYEQEKGGEQAWEEASQPAKDFAGLLKKNGGPFFKGQTVTYADFLFVSFLQFLKCVDEVALFERFLSLDPAFRKIYDASKEWLKKDD